MARTILYMRRIIEITMGDGSLKMANTGRSRRCNGCGMMILKPQLIRVVRYNGDVSVDLTYKKPGRGAYICRNQECLNMAVKKRGLERSLKTTVLKEVYEELRSILKDE